MSRVEGVGQPEATMNLAPAGATAGNERRRQEILGFEEAFFLLFAEGRRPNSKEIIVFSLGFAASLSLVFITRDLLDRKKLNPASVVIFVLSVTACGVLIRRERMAAARLAGAEPRSRAEARRPPSLVNKETRRRLLDYFVFRPPEEEKTGDKSSSATDTAINGHDEEEGGGGVGSSGIELRFPQSARGGDASGTSAERNRRFTRVWPVLPTAACTSTPPPDPGVSSPPPPPYASPRPTGVARDNSSTGGGDTADLEEGSAAAATPAAGAEAIGSTVESVESLEEESGEAGVASSETDVEAGGVSRKKSDQGDWRGTGAEDLESEEASEQGSTRAWCVICFGEYTYGEELCRLPCGHLYHAKCIDQWLDGENHGWCPLCKTDIFAAASLHSADDSRNSRSITTSQEARRWRR